MEARGTGCGRLPFEVASSLAKEFSVHVSASRERQLRFKTRILSALSADEVNILTLLVCLLV